MARGIVITVGLLAVSSGLLIGATSRAQVSPAPQNCSAPPDKSRNGGTSQKFVVERISFDRPVHLSDSDIQQVIEKVNESGRASSDGIGDLVEIELRSAWQNRGYFRITLGDAHAQSLGGDSGHERFLVTVHVINEGPEFHLGDIQFTGSTAIPEAELRQTFPPGEGEVFDAERVREGITALTKLYDSHGYIDFTATPETQVDDSLQRIVLVIHLDAQQQFRIGSVDIHGLDPNLEARFRLVAVPGETFDFESIEGFFNENGALLPPRAPEHLKVRRDQRPGIVNLTFDPRSCT